MDQDTDFVSQRTKAFRSLPQERLAISSHVRIFRHQSYFALLLQGETRELSHNSISVVIDTKLTPSLVSLSDWKDIFELGSGYTLQIETRRTGDVTTAQCYLVEAKFHENQIKLEFEELEPSQRNFLHLYTDLIALKKDHS